MIGIALALTLLFQFDRAYQPPPDAFIFTYGMSAASMLDEMRAPLSAEGACGTGEGIDTNTFCTQWPTCPKDGEVLFFWVQAVWGEERSDPEKARETMLACTVQHCTCVTLDLTQPATPTPAEVPHAPLMPPLPTFAPQYPPAPT